MKTQKLIDSLDRFGRVLPVLVQDISPQDAAWKPTSGNWSVLEIVCHLVDEELEDFGVRLQLTLEDPELSWPTWDPEGFAVSRKYNERNFQEIVDEFVAIRLRSVKWLRELGEAEWDRSYKHKTAGKISDGDLLAAWTAHDQLHVRQIAKRNYELIKRDAAPYDVSYAGPW